MTFQAPSRYSPRRVYPALQDPEPASHQPLRSPQLVEEPQEWILFSPSSPLRESSIEDLGASSARSRTVDQSFSHTSDFASLVSRGSVLSDVGDLHNAERGEVSGDAELDDLDGHLQEFRENRYWVDGAVLPAHDGLGSFRLNREALGEMVQEHLARFENFSRKRRRGDTDVGEDTRTEEQEETERRRRIEEWRIEQSQLLREEFQKESRRRTSSVSDEQISLDERHQGEMEATATLADVDETDQDSSFWTRITQKVMRNLMGLDEELLSIILGEKLPDEAGSAISDRRGISQESATSQGQPSWEYRLISRIARELGILVNQFSHDHPGAFSAYLELQQQPVPYAGRQSTPEQIPEDVTASLDFEPTLQNIPQQPSISLPMSQNRPLDAPLSRQDWERDLDVRLVYRYLRCRFSSQSSPLPTTHRRSSSADKPSARAARVRAEHPLIQEHYSSWKSPRLRRRSENCGSEARLAMSARRDSVTSSKHYWDWGQSGTGMSGVSGLSGRGMGCWGEV